jgi:azurin
MRTMSVVVLVGVLCGVMVSFGQQASARPSATATSGAGARAAASSAAPRVIQIVVGDTTKFTPAVLTAEPGESITVTLKDTGKMAKVAMAHNFVLLKKGTNTKDFIEKSAAATETDYIAPAVKDKVIAATGMVGPGETADVTFTAPPAGTYEFVCSFPGHYALGMKGTLTVK